MKEKLTLSTNEEITLIKPRVKNIRLALKKDTEADKMLCLIAMATNKTEAEIDEMELIDFATIRDEIQSFLEESKFVARM